MSSAEIADEPPGTTECPYVEVGQKVRPGQDPELNPAKRMKAEDTTGGTGKFFFGNMGSPLSLLACMISSVNVAAILFVFRC